MDDLLFPPNSPTEHANYVNMTFDVPSRI